MAALSVLSAPLWVALACSIDDLPPSKASSGGTENGGSSGSTDGGNTDTAGGGSGAGSAGFSNTGGTNDAGGTGGNSAGAGAGAGPLGSAGAAGAGAGAAGAAGASSFVPALVNGDFSAPGDLFPGWTLEGDARDFALIPCPPRMGDCLAVSTYTDEEDAATGRMSQTFLVPDDAVALRFAVQGGGNAGQAVRIALYEGDTLLEQVTGPDGNWDSEVPRFARWATPVRWDLRARRGHRVTIAIEDNATINNWGHICATGFDVIRDVPSPLINGDFSQGLTGWIGLDEDEKYFDFYTVGTNPTDDYRVNFLRIEMTVGSTRVISTFPNTKNTDVPADKKGDRARGTLRQTFTVPDNAIALRAVVAGGGGDSPPPDVHFRMYDTKRGNLLRDASGHGPQASVDGKSYGGNPWEAAARPISWSLLGLRKRQVTLALEDNAGSVGWNFITLSQIDVITTTNGP